MPGRTVRAAFGLCLCLALALPALAPPALAQTPPHQPQGRAQPAHTQPARPTATHRRYSPTEAARRQMEEAERARAAGLVAQRDASHRAEAAAAAEQRLTDERATDLARLRGTEAATARIAQRAQELAAAENAAEQRLLAAGEDLTALLPLIPRLARYPAETMLAAQPDQADALRGVLVLRGLTAQLGQEAENLRAAQEGFNRAREAAGREELRLRAAIAAQTAQAAALDRQLSSTQSTRRQQEELAAEAARSAAAQAARAETLRAAITELEAQRRAAEEQARAEATRAARERHPQDAATARRRQEALARPSGADAIAAGAQPHGQLLVPVGGPVATHYGDATPAGPASGITYRAAPRALVVAPCAGKVMFAAPFRTYGLLLIVDCGGPYHAVLAGMERLDVQPGRHLQAGESVGMMADWDARAGIARPALYLELRRDGQPVNPAPWLGGGA